MALAATNGAMCSYYKGKGALIRIGYEAYYPEGGPVCFATGGPSMPYYSSTDCQLASYSSPEYLSWSCSYVTTLKLLCRK